MIVVRKRLGRPPKPKPEGDGPRGGKGAVLSVRITIEMRRTLEAESDRTGRTLGATAEHWLEDGRFMAKLKARLYADSPA